jgi:thiamine pyrophosphate-dependent acetolactate synthase large subunit-like protein
MLVRNGAVFGDSFMNGAESLVRTLVGGGVNGCFANPGTSEMHFIAALGRVEGDVLRARPVRRGRHRRR